VFVLIAFLAHALVSILLMPSLKRMEAPVIHVQVEHGMVEILAGVGARVYYSKDGSTAADTKDMEQYLGPFTLHPGMWQLVAIAKHAGKVDSEVARFPALVCARDEDGVTVFCQQHKELPLDAAPRGHPDLYVGQCKFPSGARLRQVSDVFAEKNVTIVKESKDTRAHVARMGLMAKSMRQLCRQVASRDWPECAKGQARGAEPGAPIQYIAAVTCGFIGFASRPRKLRLAGAAPRAGGVVFDCTRFFRHADYLPLAVTGYQGADGHTAELVHYPSLALGTYAASFSSHSLHQILPPLLWMARTLPPDVPILLPHTAIGALDTLLQLLRRSDTALDAALSPSRLVGWRSVLYAADTLYFYGEWPYRSREQHGASSHRVRAGWQGCLMPQPLLEQVRTSLLVAAGAAAKSEGQVVVLAPNGNLALSLDSRQHLLTAVATLASRSTSLQNAVPLVVVMVEVTGLVMQRVERSLLEMMRIFAQADAIMGVHGAALSYVVMCRRGTPVLEMGYALSQDALLAEIAARGNSDAAADAEEASPNTGTHGRWNPTFRLLCAALELPYWALPAQWMNKAGTELAVDPLLVSGWLAGPAALALATNQTSPLPSPLGYRARRAAATPISASGGGLPSVVVGGVASGVARAAAKGGEIGVGVGGEGGVEMEADVGWLLCVASPRGALDDTDALGKATVGNGGADGIGEAVGNAAHLRAVRVSSESGEGGGWGAVDGRKDTRWLSQGMSDNEFLELDLGGVERVCAVRLEWGIATALSFEIQVSAPQRWESVYVRHQHNRSSASARSARSAFAAAACGDGGLRGRRQREEDGQTGHAAPHSDGRPHRAQVGTLALALLHQPPWRARAGPAP